MKVLDLFSGIGGFSLGLERAGMTTVGMCEIDPFCRQVLRKHWPEVWIHDDVRTLTTPLIRERCGHIDLIAGGFPCQDLSAAGKGAGLDGERSGLWWELCGVIARLRPRWLLVENVPALRTRGADRVLSCLEGIGYSVWPLVVGAWAVGAPHKRDRVWIVGRLADGARHGQRQQPASERADRQRAGASGDAELANADERGRRIDEPERSEEGRAFAGRTGEAVADTERGKSVFGYGVDVQRRWAPQAEQIGLGSGAAMGNTLCDRLRIGRGATTEESDERRHRALWPARPGEPQHEWEAPRLLVEPVGWPVARISAWMDECVSDWVTNGKTTKAGPVEIMQFLWPDSLPQEVQRHAGGQDQIPGQKVLRCDLHGPSKNNEQPSATHPLQEGRSDPKDLLRQVQENVGAGSSSHRRGHRQQCGGKPDDAVRLLPHEVALGARQDTPQTIGLCRLWTASEKKGLLPETLVSVLEIWRSLDDQEKLRAGEVCIGPCLSKRIRRSNKLSLKAYGNTVVPRVVEAIGRAILEVWR